MMYQADEKRYETMQYNRCGKSGLLLPKVSLGLWHNFGSNGDYDNMKAMCFTAFDHGITHFDLANNYGPEPGSAEKNGTGVCRYLLSSPYGSGNSIRGNNGNTGADCPKRKSTVCWDFEL